MHAITNGTFGYEMNGNCKTFLHLFSCTIYRCSRTIVSILILSYAIMLTLTSASTVRCTLCEFTQNPRPLYYARQSISTFVCHRGRMVRIRRATHGGHETVDEWGLSICQDCPHHHVREKGQHQSSHWQGRAVYPRCSGKPVLLATSSKYHLPFLQLTDR